MEEACDRSVNTLEVMMTHPCGFVAIGNIVNKNCIVRCIQNYLSMIDRIDKQRSRLSIRL